MARSPLPSAARAVDMSVAPSVLTRWDRLTGASPPPAVLARLLRSPGNHGAVFGQPPMDLHVIVEASMKHYLTTKEAADVVAQGHLCRMLAGMARDRTCPTS